MKRFVVSATVLKLLWYWVREEVHRGSAVFSTKSAALLAGLSGFYPSLAINLWASMIGSLPLSGPRASGVK